jgi:hypothetical protein
MGGGNLENECKFASFLHSCVCAFAFSHDEAAVSSYDLIIVHHLLKSPNVPAYLQSRDTPNCIAPTFSYPSWPIPDRNIIPTVADHSKDPWTRGFTNSFLHIGSSTSSNWQCVEVCRNEVGGPAPWWRGFGYANGEMEKRVNGCFGLVELTVCVLKGKRGGLE